MSLRDEGGKEECFEYDCQHEERKPAREQHETLDLVEEGKFCALLKSDPFPANVWIGLAVVLNAQHLFFGPVEVFCQAPRSYIVSGLMTLM